MSYNHKKSQNSLFPIKIKDQELQLNSQQISELIIKRMETDPAVLRVFKEFETDISKLSELKIEIVELNDRYAETDIESMRLSPQLFKGGNFFRDYYFVIVHEIVHWLTRVKESRAFFNDPEEVDGFLASIMSELSRGISVDEIWNKIFPKIEFHFHNREDARQFFTTLLEKAQASLG